MSSPASDRDDVIIRALAKQAYRYELLVKALRERGNLGVGSQSRSRMLKNLTAS
jgi:hypothetical protein